VWSAGRPVRLRVVRPVDIVILWGGVVGCNEPNILMDARTDGRWYYGKVLVRAEGPRTFDCTRRCQRATTSGCQRACMSSTERDDDEQADAVRQRLALYRGTDQLKRFRSVGFFQEAFDDCFGLAVNGRRVEAYNELGLFRADIDLHLGANARVDQREHRLLYQPEERHPRVAGDQLSRSGPLIVIVAPFSRAKSLA